MGTNPSSLLEIELLLKPIPGANPAGSTLPLPIRERLEAGRREVDPNDYDADDPQRPSSATKADWPAIVELGQEVLKGTSKDLSVAARLAEALVKLYGFAGLGDGLRLIRRLVEECWDRLSPELEADDDLEIRGAPFRWIDDPNRGAAFPNTVRSVPMVFGSDGDYGWQDWRRSQDPRAATTREAFDKARLATPLKSSRETVALLASARVEFDGMVKALNERLGESAPGMIGLRQALDDCQLLAQQILQLNTETLPPDEQPGSVSASASASAAAAAPGADEAQEAGPAMTAASRHAVTRDQIYNDIARAAEALRRLEPHSPIPYLLERAVLLGSLAFPDLMREIVRDANVLAAMSRELGIREPAPEQ